jgi:ABC-type phosphate/phosphonate transport system substrate-binding protein
MDIRRTALGLGLAALLLAQAAPRAQATDRMAFVGVSIDGTTREADRRLTEYFYERAGIRFTSEELEYGAVIQRLIDWRREDGPFVARVTPYALVVAELLGANVEPLATYVSATTGQTTYRSHLVVSRSAFDKAPGLPDVLRLLSSKRARFIYHNEFSTSSFFLPALFFRANDVFHMPEGTQSLTAIAASKIDEGGTQALVERVAAGTADISAVWDGVKARFETDPALVGIGRRVYFVDLPTPIPNDLLVAPSWIDADARNRLREAIGAMPADAVAIGDFRRWQNLTDAPNARLALSDLRQAARQTPARVPVEIRLAQGAGSSDTSLVEAARQAVRLSETEFVVFDADYHAQPDVRWTLESIHDGAVVLRSSIPSYALDDQSFQISFRDLDNLTARIVSIIQSRLHRIRYVWSYSGSTPIVLRDSAFALPASAPVRVRRITWVDPDRNQFRAGEEFGSRITRTTFHRYDLLEEDFRHPASGERPGPLSNASYRVILVRPPDRSTLFRALTGSLVALFFLAAAAAIWSLVRETSAGSATARPSAP